MLMIEKIMFDCHHCINSIEQFKHFVCLSYCSTSKVNKQFKYEQMCVHCFSLTSVFARFCVNLVKA